MRLPLLLVSLVLVLSGCTGQKRQEARALVEQGYTTSTELQGYYTGLVSEADSFMQIYRFSTTLAGQPMDEKVVRQVRDLRKAAKAREQSSEHLADLYESLGQLMKFDARTAVQHSASNLQQSLGSLGDNPVTWNNVTIDPLQVLEQIDADIQIARQEKRVEHQAPVVAKTVRVVANLFEREAGLYVSMQKEDLDARRDFAKSLLAKGEAIPDTVLLSQLQALGLRYNPGPVIDERERAAIDAWIDDSTDKAQEQLEPAAKRLIRKLRALEEAHRKFLPNAR